MLDEGALRERFPEIPWDQPVRVDVPRGVDDPEILTRWCCRYCIALRGLKATVIDRMPFAFITRPGALIHIEQQHHD